MFLVVEREKTRRKKQNRLFPNSQVQVVLLVDGESDSHPLPPTTTVSITTVTVATSVGV